MTGKRALRKALLLTKPVVIVTWKPRNELKKDETCNFCVSVETMEVLEMLLLPKGVALLELLPPAAIMLGVERVIAAVINRSLLLVRQDLQQQRATSAP